jgi:hypothetical protein
MSAREAEPAIERRRSTFTPTTGLNANCVRHLLDNVTKAYVLVGDESRKAHLETRAFTFIRMVILALFLIHGIPPCP